MTVIHETADIQTLRSQINGTLLTPADPDYAEMRLSWNRSVTSYPALIIVASDVQDIVTGVRFAADHQLRVAVQSTGHGVKYASDDNLLIITSQMNGVQLNAEARTVRVEAGVIWQQVIDAASPYGLAPLLGSSPHVGVIGYSLAGGIGWLARQYGLAADSIRWIELVTADGQLHRASPTENSELFWGLRGGVGNFGVVTAMEIDLYPVALVYGGGLVYPADRITEALPLYRDWVKTLPDEMTTSFAVFKFPSLPHLPDAVRGKTLMMMRAAYTGAAADGVKLIQPWLDWQPPIQNTFREMPFSEIATISNDPVDPAASRYSHEMFDELSDDAIAVIAHHATDRASALMITEIRHAGGAIARVPAASNAIANREAQFYLQMAAVAFNPELEDAIDEAIHNFKTALKAYVRGGVYLNFMGGREAIQRVRDAYLPESYERLLALKAHYDPNNLFRYSFPLITP